MQNIRHIYQKKKKEKKVIGLIHTRCYKQKERYPPATIKHDNGRLFLVDSKIPDFHQTNRTNL